MKMVEGIKAKITKDKVSLIYNKKVFLVLGREAFASLLNVDVDFPDENDQEIDKFIATYNHAKEKFYKRKVSKTFKKTDKEYRCFAEALDILKRHDVEYNTYIQSQVDGLEFAKVFPKPCQLNTTKAEERLLDYLRKVDVEGTAEQNELELSAYKVNVEKIKAGNATLNEAKQAARYEINKLGGIKEYTKAYLSFIKK
jgi:hypothetical protein